MKRVIVGGSVILALGAVAMLHGAAIAQTPYAGMQTRAVKALSDKDVADLKAGRGMGLALAAELNGYPGPSHVLDNADALGLTAEQRERTRALFEAMKAEALPVGAQLIEQETRLDQLFATRQITPAVLTTVTAEIGATQGRLRETHLKYHLTMMTVLTAEQIQKYQALRGYGEKGGPQHQHHHN
jgi:Spy/CpxP family protein refolding chaperone